MNNRISITKEMISVLNLYYDDVVLKKNILLKLEKYQFINSLHDIVIGRYVRWIHIDGEILTKGGIVLRIKEDIMLIQNLWNHSNPYKVVFTNVLIFQKIPDDEFMMMALNNLIEPSA